MAHSNSWDFPKIRGPSIDPRIAGLFLEGHPQKGPPIHRSSQLATAERSTRVRADFSSTAFCIEPKYFRITQHEPSTRHSRRSLIVSLFGTEGCMAGSSTGLYADRLGNL